MNTMLQGSFVALPTPFRGAELDFASFDRLVEFHVESGTKGIVVAGTSGEAATLSSFERRTLIETAVATSGGRLPVVAGVGTNSTSDSIEFTRFATQAGVDALLAVTPYYNRPSPSGLFQHYAALAEASDLPLILYNVPSRTGVDLKPDTVAALREAYPHIAAIKEASGSMTRARQILESSDIGLIAGVDELIAEIVGIGGLGVIGVVGNIVPREVAELVRCAVPGGDPVRTAELHAKLAPLVEACFVETNPVPMKAALADMGLIESADVRLPLTELEPQNRERVLAALREAQLVTA